MLSHRIFQVALEADTSITAFANTDNAVDTNSLTTYSFASLDFGAAAGNRFMVACIAGVDDSDGQSVSSATIGGVSATIFAEASDWDGSFASYAAIIGAAVPTGATGTVSVTWSSGFNTSACAVYRMIGGSPSTAFASIVDETEASGELDLDVNVPEGGAVVAMTSQRNGGTTTWTGVTEDYEVDQGTSEWFSAASAYPTSAASPRTITAQSSDTTPSDMCGIAVSWQ